MTVSTGSAAARTITLDAHVHTEASHDCSTSPERVVSAAIDAGLDAIAVTDHDVIVGALRMVKAAEDTDLLVVPGAEVSTADGHLLAIGVETVPEPGRPFDESVATVRAAGGVAVVPHPFQTSRSGVQASAIEDCDGIETLNAVAVTGYQNRRARQFALREGYPAIGGSDAHRSALIGRAFTSVALPEGVDWTRMTAANVLAGIRAGDAAAQGTVTTPIEFAQTYAWHARDTASTALGSTSAAARNGHTALRSRPLASVGAVLGSAMLLSSFPASLGRVPKQVAGRLRL